MTDNPPDLRARLAQMAGADPATEPGDIARDIIVSREPERPKERPCPTCPPTLVPRTR